MIKADTPTNRQQSDVCSPQKTVRLHNEQPCNNRFIRVILVSRNKKNSVAITQIHRRSQKSSITSELSSLSSVKAETPFAICHLNTLCGNLDTA